MLELLLLFGEVELPLPLLLLPGELRLEPDPSLLLELEPPGEVAPPVEEAGEVPKYEYTLCRQLGCERSEFGSNVGAPCSLL